jgi:hypothetical protein
MTATTIAVSCARGRIKHAKVKLDNIMSRQGEGWWVGVVGWMILFRLSSGFVK